MKEVTALETEMGKPVTAGKTALPNRTIKDSVFRDIFSHAEYLLELYKVLHPEDTTATEADLGNVTIRNVLMGNLYNDLGFTVRNRLLIMIEAQSTWTVNIVIRILMYLADTWNTYINETLQNPYGSKKLDLPEPEFYVIFTGERVEHPEWISLADEFFRGKSSLDLKAKILYGDNSNDILDQYITFTKILGDQISRKGRTREAVSETIRICKDREILKTYLESREKEVIGIMMTLFDQEYLNKIYIRERTEEARAEARENTQKEIAIRMHEQGCSAENIALMLGISIDTVTEWITMDSVFA